MTVLLSLVFFVSGAAALIFETLWFRQAGLMLGNSIWASSLVTSSFMGGLAIGNAFAGRRGGDFRRPLLAYASLEAAIAVTGVSLVIFLPGFTAFLAPAFTPLLASPGLLNFVRFVAAFVLLLVPATAMGATLPILAGALSGSEPRFARVLGMLYGWNTLGAVTGALAAEGVLVERFGVTGAAWCAAALNLAAIVAALSMSRRLVRREELEEAQASASIGSPARKVLGAAFLAGGVLLALEVVWFRLLLLFVFGTSLAFAVMLAVVLLGIGAGGLLAGFVVREDEGAWRWLSPLALVAGATTVWTYSSLPDVLALPPAAPLADPASILALSLRLMLPTSILSGALFTLMGAAMKAEGRGAARAAGAVAFANTLGAMIGPLAGTFVLLPLLGLEKTLFLLACAYGAIAFLTSKPARLRGTTSALATIGFWVAAAGFALFTILFPFGLMRNNLSLRPAATYLLEGQRIEGYREGLTETITYLARDLWGETAWHRLLTNSHSMSGSHFASARYMRYFVYLPVALRPAPKNALLISYGVGITARALTDTQSLERVDVVDISRDILELGRLVFPRPGTFPLDDPRVHVHVEDGRFFLLTTDRKFDLITAEPPPPKASGVVNLYSKEHFELIRAKLSPGGITSYWLPVYQMTARESKAIARGFCEVFEDCSLWTGTGLEWMLVGSARAANGVTEEAFGKQWRDPVTGPELQALGFERPELFGTTFLMDAPRLRQWTADSDPLDDDHPMRLSPRAVGSLDPEYLKLMDATTTRAAFEASDWIRATWPSALRERTLAEFETQRLVNRASPGYGEPSLFISEFEAILRGTRMRIPVLTAFFTTDAEMLAAHHAASRNVDDPFLDELLAIDALADRDYSRAADFFQKAERGERAGELRPFRVLALGLANRLPEARQAIGETKRPASPAGQATWAWLANRFGWTPAK